MPWQKGKLKDQTWDDLPRSSRLARLMFPASEEQQATDEIEKEITRRSAALKKKRGKKARFLDDKTRGAVSRLGGVAVKGQR
jgi:hypothetical protein